MLQRECLIIETQMPQKFRIFNDQDRAQFGISDKPILTKREMKLASSGLYRLLGTGAVSLNTAGTLVIVKSSKVLKDERKPPIFRTLRNHCYLVERRR